MAGIKDSLGNSAGQGSLRDSSFSRRGDSHMTNAFDDMSLVRASGGKKNRVGSGNAADDNLGLFGSVGGPGNKNLLGIDASGPGSFILGQSSITGGGAGVNKKRDR